MTEEATSDTTSGSRSSTNAGAANGESSGYVHDPSEFSRDGDGDGRGGGDDDGPRTTRAYHHVGRSDEFGTKGWVLVGMLFVAFVCVPVVILLIPYSHEFIRSLGLSWRDAYLTLPLVPALVLGALAVWVAVSD